MARTIAVGVGIMEYPFDTTDGFWRWVDLCESGGLDSIWQTDRMISRSTGTFLLQRDSGDGPTTSTTGSAKPSGD